MTWTAELTGKRVEHGRVWIEVKYTQDNVTHTETHNLTNTDPKHIKRILQNDVNKFDAVDPLEFNVPVGSTLDITPDPVIPPAQDEIDEAAWFEGYRELQQSLEVTSNIPALLTPAVQTIIDDLRTTLAATWKNAYRNKI